jgi:sn-glycerol 3-phosphate transport system substrate-binding protein
MGTTFLPKFEGYPTGRAMLGGGCVSVLKGHPKKDYDATKEFLKWIMRPETTMQWHKDTGYAATSKTALKKLTDEGWFIEHPNHLTGFLQMLSGTKTPGMEPFLFGQFYEIRKHVHTAFEYSFSGKTPPKAALDEAAKKANRILQEYADMYK